MDNKTIYLHIGTHKTGTSSIQSFLSNNNDLPDFEYPNFGKWRGGHHHIAWYYLKDKRYDKQKFNLDHFKKYINKSQNHKFLFSSEDLSRFNPKLILALKQDLSKFNIKIVVYLREQFDYLISAWSTVIRNGTSSSDFETFAKNSLKSRYNFLHYYNFVSSWSNVFGKENLIVKIFNKKNPNLIEEVLGILELDINKNLITKAPIKNSRLSFSFLNVLKEVNKLDLKLDHNSRNKFNENFLGAITEFYTEKDHNTSPISKDKLGDLVRNTFKDANRKLSEQYFEGKQIFH